MQERIPIYLAAIGPKNTALAGEIADGWIPTLLLARAPARAARDARGGRGARRAARWTGFDIAPTVSVCITDDVDAARDAMRPFIALYVGGMGSRDKNFYNQLVQRYGFEDAAQRDPGPLPGGQEGRGGRGGPRRSSSTAWRSSGRATRARAARVYREAASGRWGSRRSRSPRRDRLEQLRLVAELAG